MSAFPRSPVAPSKSAARCLLLLSPFAPRLDASMGGPLLIAQLVMALSQRERVALLYLQANDEPPLDERVKQACEAAIGVTRNRHSAARTSFAMLDGLPPWVAEWREPEYISTLNAFAADWQPHVVQAEFHLMGQYLAALGRNRPPAVLNQHEPGAAATADRLRSGLMPGRILPRLSVLTWQHYERRLARQFDVTVTFTERDRKVMQELGASRVEVIPPGASIPLKAASPVGTQPPSILFFGNYLHAPNIDAALRLARDIFPRLAEEVPDLRLFVLGDRAPDELRALASDRISVPGRVPDLKPYLDQASVVVVPLRIGGGMRVKVLEAIAAGKAVVASPRALEGLDFEDGLHALSAESDDEFVTQVLRLLREPDERAALAARARAWAAGHLDWDRAARQYAALYDQLLLEPRPRVQEQLKPWAR